MRCAVRVTAVLIFPVVLAVNCLGCGSQESQHKKSKVSLKGGESKASDANEGSRKLAVTAVQLQADEANSASPAVAKEDLFPEVLVRTSLGSMRIRLNAEKAPRTVENFLSNYVDRKFYNQTIIDRVEVGFAVAGGGYTVDYQAKETRTAIRHEGENGLKNLRGSIAMLRDAEYIHSATSQFFINLTDNPSLDYQEIEEVEGESRDPVTWGYCVFGEVIEGLDVLEKISETALTDKEDFPRTPSAPVIIETIQRVR